ncbi:hypothetical protein Fleli_2123 [Bernardetia litoralis DSM 6794]|uniref:Uncharacterized protein n=1 Tax=Bernardetia litoralis (strain ATCC 23117 / DSM 6794 / NBRC 15988 / NCIMB 1366 / Fx l1 / Sio-4) TaxID=880071 RepID=I4AKM0_BERLS|nr:hypothetical protein [Bernardetia litoralis]AFM04505.1 hypothetical protein Fleli_2123 [Bernardetia litoralis DSM 6794]
MKKLLFLSCFLLITSVCFSQSTLPKAYLTNELYVMLDGEAPVTSKVFEADMSEFNFTTSEQTTRFFNFFDDPMVSFDPNLTTQKVTITITPTSDKTNWELQEWAMYFKNKIATQREQLGFVDFTQR